MQAIIERAVVLLMSNQRAGKRHGLYVTVPGVFEIQVRVCFDGFDKLALSFFSMCLLSAERDLLDRLLSPSLLQLLLHSQAHFDTSTWPQGSRWYLF